MRYIDIDFETLEDYQLTPYNIPPLYINEIRDYGDDIYETYEVDYDDYEIVGNSNINEKL